MPEDAEVVIRFEFSTVDTANVSFSEEEIDAESDEGNPVTVDVTQPETVKFGGNHPKDVVLEALGEFVQAQAGKGFESVTLEVEESSITGVSKDEIEQAVLSQNLTVAGIEYVESVDTDQYMPDPSRGYSIEIVSNKNEDDRSHKSTNDAEFTTNESVDTGEELKTRLQDKYEDGLSSLEDSGFDMDDHRVEIRLKSYYEDKVSDEEIRELFDEATEISITYT